MEPNSSVHIMHWLKIPLVHSQDLYDVRHVEGLLVLEKDSLVWIKNIQSEYRLSSPFSTLRNAVWYDEKDGELYLHGHLLPEAPIPEGEWQELKSYLPILKPKHNVNYFGVSGRVRPELKKGPSQNSASAMMVSLVQLERYIQEAPEIRLQKLLWTCVDHSALLLGEPLLPIPGKTFWGRGKLFLPEGFVLKQKALHSAFYQQMEPEGRSLVFLTAEDSFFKVRISDFVPLSRYSVRQTKLPSK